jgi:hypothetical protein
VAAVALAAVLLALVARVAMRGNKALRTSKMQLKNEQIRADAAESKSAVAVNAYNQAARTAAEAVGTIQGLQQNAAQAWYVATGIDEVRTTLSALYALATGEEPIYAPRGRHALPPDDNEQPADPVQGWLE